MDLAEAYRLEQRLLDTQLAVLRSTIEHAAEKGRVLESYVHRFLREALPQEYGITTGFIAFPPEAPGAEPTLSEQLDVIIYDALRGAPLMRLPTCDVIPLEAALGYVEVKAQVDSAVLRECAETANRVRRHTTRWFWASLGANEAVPVGLLRCISTRAYLFAFEGPAKPETVQDTLERALTEVGELASFSGAFINGCGYFQSGPLAPPVEADGAFAALRHGIVHGLARYPRYAPMRLRGPHAIQESQTEYAHAMMQGELFQPPEYLLPGGDRRIVTDILDLTTAYLDHYSRAGSVPVGRDPSE